MELTAKFVVFRKDPESADRYQSVATMISTVKFDDTAGDRCGSLNLTETVPIEQNDVVGACLNTSALGVLSSGTTGGGLYLSENRICSDDSIATVDTSLNFNMRPTLALHLSAQIGM